jgi:hypothetical protein
VGPVLPTSPGCGGETCRTRYAANPVTPDRRWNLSNGNYRARRGTYNQIRQHRAGEDRGEPRLPWRLRKLVRQTMATMQQHAASGEVTTVQDVAEAVFRAATDPGCPMILPAGADAIAWSLRVRPLLSSSVSVSPRPPTVAWRFP